MQKCYIGALVVAIMLINVNLSSAQHPAMGAGTQSCGRWASVRASNDEAAIVGEGMMTAWLQGFVTGLWLIEHLEGDASFAIPDAEAIQVWLDNRCIDRPLEQLVMAGTALVKELKARK